jgi:hypothetical protein
VSKVWPRATIRELLARAKLEGEARASLTTSREAELFRFAIYNFRKEADEGHDVVLTLEDNTVVATHRPLPVVRLCVGED